LPKLYIDEKAGSDETGTGAELSPFQTLVKAYQSLNLPASADADPTKAATFLVRKPDSVERNEFVELGTSGRKKLIKGIELWRKKEAKASQEGERLAKDKLAAEERDQKRREEAQAVVLVDQGDAKKVRAMPGRADKAD
jgi:asparaginyl-tRNA synthetase